MKEGGELEVREEEGEGREVNEGGRGVREKGGSFVKTAVGQNCSPQLGEPQEGLDFAKNSPHPKRLSAIIIKHTT